MSLHLHDYQREDLLAINAAALEYQSLLCVAATGLGKTVEFVNLPRIGARRMLVIAHRDELISQPVKRWRAWNPGIPYGVEKAEQRSQYGLKPDPVQAALMHEDEPERYAVFASIQTLTSGNPMRIERFRPDAFDVIVIDEAHHARARTYGIPIKYFGVHDPAGGPRLIGFTATAFVAGPGGEKLGLQNRFQTIAVNRSLTWGIRNGWLCPIEAEAVETNTSLDEVEVMSNEENDDGQESFYGEFKQRQLERVVATSTRNAVILKAYIERCGGTMKALGFAAGVGHAEMLAQVFNDHGIVSDWVCGTTPKKRRQQINDDFASGKIRVLWNYGTHTEGFDEPSIEVLLLGRPVRSPVLFQQMIGRGTRIYRGKECVRIIDFLDVSRKHDVFTIADLFSLPRAMALTAMKKARTNILDTVDAVEKLREDGATDEELARSAAICGDISKLTLSFKKIHLNNAPEIPEAIRSFAKLLWIDCGDGVYRLNCGHTKIRVGRELALGRTFICTIKKASEESEASTKFDTLQEAIKFAETLARGSGHVLVDPTAAWLKHPATQAQIDRLRKLKVEIPDGVTKGVAARLITNRLEVLRRRRERG